MLIKTSLATKIEKDLIVSLLVAASPLAYQVRMSEMVNIIAQVTHILAVQILEAPRYLSWPQDAGPYFGSKI